MRTPKHIKAIRSFYEFSAGRPDLATTYLKHLYRAVARLNRTTFNKMLKRIEDEIKAEREMV